MRIRSRIIVLKTIFILLYFRVLLQVWGIKALRKSWFHHSHTVEATPEFARQIRERIRISARFVPGAMCLPRALAANYFLRRRGFESIVRIGVKRTDEGSVSAHAWVISGSTVVVGGDDNTVTQFSHLVDAEVIVD